MRFHWRTIVLLVTSVLMFSAGTALTSPAPSPAYADVDNYHIDSWTVHTHLSTDGQGRALAQVTETITPVFPEHDQIRGITRAIPLTYASADATPQQISVHNKTGQEVPFTIEDNDPFRVILIGDDTYVHGPQHYELSYEIPDVIRPITATAETTASDEWYWDIIPLERAQPITAASARVTFDNSLADQLTDTAACYTGPAHDTTQCALDFNPEKREYSLAPMPLDEYAGITLAIGFTPNSVAQPDVRLPDPLLDIGPIILAAITLGLGLTATTIVWTRQRREARHRGTIIAQYDVPSHLPPLIAGPITRTEKSVIAAQIVHLAVNGELQFEEPAEHQKDDAPQLRRTEHTQITTSGTPTIDPIDTSTLHELFGASPPNSRITIPKHSESFAAKMTALKARGITAASERGYLINTRTPLAQVFGYCAIGTFGLTILLLIAGSDRDHTATWLISLGALALGLFFAAIGLIRVRVHTPLGAETREYLLGLKEFITVAEADRIRMLQSYSGTERATDTTSKTEVLRVYERLLPYAILFGQEKEWARILETQYAATEYSAPTWYPAAGVIGLSQLDRSLTHLTQSFTSAASYTESSTGGATGGGYSGGGGGGGYSGGR